MINANKEKLGAFFSGQVQYVVPFYQRSYVWKEENWEALWDSIWNIYEDAGEDPQSKTEHFIGTLITKQRPAEQLGENKYDVIDGQQRLTTIALLLKAMAVSSTGELTHLGQILNELLSFGDARGHKHLRIVHSRIDAGYFNAIINQEGLIGLENPDHLMNLAFEFFKNKLEDLDDPKMDLLRQVVLNRVPVVSMLLSAEDDEQVIFDTINSLGVKLTTAELLKNHIFREEELQDLYNAYWLPMFEEDEDQINFWNKEKTAGRVIRTNVEILLYCYLVIKTRTEVKLETLFKEYKRWLGEKNVSERKDFLIELHRYAETYLNFPADEELTEIAFADGEERFFHVIENLEITTVLPLVLYIYNTIIDSRQRQEMVVLLESYLVRRNVCRYTTKNYNNLFVEIIRALAKVSSIENRPIDKNDLLTILSAYEEETNVFPDDRAFAEGFAISALTNKNAKEILYCIALKQKEDPNADVQKLNGAGLSVEHIMPRKWEQNWKLNDMTEEGKAERNKKLRTLGNLTLVTKRLNSKMQNAKWDDKKPELRRYSSLEMTTHYLDNDIWDENAIGNRAEDLMKIALEIWPRTATVSQPYISPPIKAPNKTKLVKRSKTKLPRGCFVDGKHYENANEAIKALVIVGKIPKKVVPTTSYNAHQWLLNHSAKYGLRYSRDED